MVVKIQKNIDKSAVLVALLPEGKGIGRHLFLKTLPAGDRNYLSKLEEKGIIRADVSRLILLPSSAQTLLIAVPGRQKFTMRKALVAMRRVIAVARAERIKHIEAALEDFMPREKLSIQELAAAAATQFVIANFEFVDYKEPPKEGWGFVEAAALIPEKFSAALEAAVRRGVTIGEEINAARRLANTPGGDMTPAKLADAALRAGKETGFVVKILEEPEIKKLGMGGVLGVSKGSAERPRFIILEYLKGGKKEKPVVLVGKGVTFDTGGLNLKPDQHIYEMHMDMSGGAAVIHAIGALARLKIKKNVVGLIPAVENMPSGSSYHPGDLLKTMSGKTIEVLNTDAEGRVILADALTYAKRYNPQLIIDIATLTGAAGAALGQRASAIFTNTPRLEQSFRALGEKTGDFVWPLPLWEEYEEEIKGTFGDVANLGKTRYGGAITGAVFLWQFVKPKPDSKEKETPWMHLDIAPRMTTIDGEFLAKGAAGAAINLLVHFLSK
jgi:leucyl aminopeptidase